MSQDIWENPYSGVAESGVTSNVLDTRDAWDLSVSIYISSGTSSYMTFQVSNSSLAGSLIPEASWSVWTVYKAPSGNSSNASLFEPPLGFRWARFLRPASNASFVVDWVRTLREPR